jgi:hypothetical protein
MAAASPSSAMPIAFSTSSDKREAISSLTWVVWCEWMAGGFPAGLPDCPFCHFAKSET